MTTPLEFTKKTLPDGPSRSGTATPVNSVPASALSLLIDKNKDQFDGSAEPSQSQSQSPLTPRPIESETFEDENQGFVAGAGEIGNISIPRYGSSTSIASMQRGTPAGSASVEARFIVNMPKTPSSASVSTSSGFLGRSLSKISLSGRRANRTNSVSRPDTAGSYAGSYHSRSDQQRSGSVSSASNLKRLLGNSKTTPDDSPAGSVDSGASGFPGFPGANGSGFPSANGSAGSVGGYASSVGGGFPGPGSYNARNTTSIKSYGKLGKTLGEGAGGHVKIVKSSNGQMYAVKEFRSKHPSETQREYQKKLGAEYCLGLTLHHPNVISTLDIVQEPDRVYHVMEYCEYDLFAIVMSGKMKHEEVFCDFAQIISGVKYLHDAGIGHRDLKLDNCVVNAEGIVKIIDFGAAVVYRYPESQRVYDTHGVVGSDPYLAPEAAGSDRYDPCATDVWSAAIILCSMLNRKFPWRAPKASDPSFKTFIKVGDDGERKGLQNLLNHLPPASHELVTGMLDLDPISRYTIDQCMDSDFFKSIECCSAHEPGYRPKDHEHSTVPFEEAHIAMLEKKNRKAKKGEKIW